MSSPVLKLSPARRRLVVGALLAGTFLASLEIMVVSPAVPQLVESLGGAGLYPWVFSAYVVAQTVMMPVYGVLADRWGRRPSYALAVCSFALGSLGCAVAPSMPWLIAARVVQGLGAGGLVPLTQTVFGDLYTVEDRTRMQAAFSMVWALSSLLGPAVGGWLTEHWSWRGAFWINLPPAAVAAALVLAFLPGGAAIPTQGSRGPGLIDGVRALSRVRVQQAVWVSGLALGGALLGVVGYLPLQIQTIDGGTPTDAGIAIIPLSLAWTAAAFVSGRLVGRLGFRTLVRIGAVVAVLGSVWAAVHTASRLGLVGLGLGMGLMISCFNVAVQEGAPTRLRGQATALGLLARSIGRAVGVVAFAWVAGIEVGAEDFGSAAELEAGLIRVFWGIAACVGTAALVVWLGFPQHVSARTDSPAQNSL